MVLLDWKSMVSLVGTLVFIRQAILNFLPPEVYKAVLRRLFSKFFSFLQPKLTIIIEEFDNCYSNEIYDAVQAYLSNKCLSSVHLKVSKPRTSQNLTFAMTANQEFEETFEGFKVKWSFHIVERISNNSQDNRLFKLSFNPKNKEKVHSSYLPHVFKEAEVIVLKKRERRLYTNRSSNDDGRLWSSVPFSHPSTFNTVAINPVLKEEIKEDLLKFVSQREFYNRVGRAWKRGYLLYGPPGTGKTTLIAAIANLLEFDIYDLELTAVINNSQLRKLLISTTSKSIIIVEDVDCSLDLSDRKKKEDEGGWQKGRQQRGCNTVSLSGVLNFVDGLWSSCGGERLIIFTTNYKENLDPALLRPGRMDKHINLSYCEITAFKTLAKNYLDLDKHELMKEVEEFLPLVKMTPADIAEIFMSCKENAEVGMKNVVEEIKKRLGLAGETKEEVVVECAKEENPVADLLLSA